MINIFHTVVLTCGTSFNTSSNIYHMTPEIISELNLKRSGHVTDMERRKIDQWLNTCKCNLFTRYIADHHAKISAEFSAVYALWHQKRLTEKPRIILIATKSVGGAAAAALLQSVFDCFFQAQVITRFIGMDIYDRSELKNQLSDYLGTLNDCLLEGECNTTCFVPLGGYKLMTAYGYLVGSFLGYASFYMQEGIEELIEVPPVPLAININFTESELRFIRRFINESVLEMDQLVSSEKEFIRKHAYFFTQEEGMVEINPFGNYQITHDSSGKLNNLLEPWCAVECDVSKVLDSNPSKKSFVAGQLQTLIRRLKNENEEELPDELAHEHKNSWKKLDLTREHNHLYLGAVHSTNGVFRAAYQYDRRIDKLTVDRIWFDHNHYEKDVQKGIGIYRSDNAKYFDWSEQLYLS